MYVCVSVCIDVCVSVCVDVCAHMFNSEGILLWDFIGNRCFCLYCCICHLACVNQQYTVDELWILLHLWSEMQCSVLCALWLVLCSVSVSVYYSQCYIYLWLFPCHYLAYKSKLPHDPPPLQAPGIPPQTLDEGLCAWDNSFVTALSTACSFSAVMIVLFSFLADLFQIMLH